MLHALLIAAALATPGSAQTADNGCDFAPPTPLLLAHGYAGQSFVPAADQTAIERANLGNGVSLTITHTSCVDEVTHEYVLTAPNDPKSQGFVAWADFARGELSRLKAREPKIVVEVVAFLKKARTMAPKNGVITLCLDGKVEDECDWGSGGTLSVEVKPGAKTTQVTVVESNSG